MAACVKMGRKYWKITGCFLLVTIMTSFVFLNKDTVLSQPPTEAISNHVNDAAALEAHRKFSRDLVLPRDELNNKAIPHDLDNQSADFIGKRKLEETSILESSLKHPKNEVRHIGFLKVHKAASSTMQNMYFRFGLKRNLTFVFTEHPNYFSRVYDKHIPIVKASKRSGGYDILCNHGVFNYNIYSSLLPNDTVYIGIVRDPLAVFISAVNYYTQKSQMIRYLWQVPGNKLQNLIRKPEVFDKGFFTYTKNVMARDFGFPPIMDGVQEKLNGLGKQFRLVLLVEYFEESLILMKRYLNWKLQDILYISNNVYGKGRSVADLTPSDIELFRKRNSLDYAVYNYFYDRFWKQFEEESDDIHSEVLNFKHALQLVFTFCKQKNVTGPLSIPETKWNQETLVTGDDCKYMTMDELELIRYMRYLQGSELPGKKPAVIRKKLPNRATS